MAGLVFRVCMGSSNIRGSKYHVTGLSGSWMISSLETTTPNLISLISVWGLLMPGSNYSKKNYLKVKFVKDTQLKNS